MAGIKRIIEENDTRAGKAFDLFIQFLIFVSLITFSIETFPDLSDKTRALLRKIEIATVSIFTVEYVLRLAVADRRVRFAFSFFGIIDLLAILPFYVSVGIDARSVRVFRLLRLFRIFKVVRYSKAIQRFHRALLIAKEELVLFGTTALMVLFLAAAGIHHFEHEVQPDQFRSVFHSLWWATVSLTTVGYGDVVPKTTGGRIFTFFVLVIGMGVISALTGIVSSALTKARGLELNNDDHTSTT